MTQADATPVTRLFGGPGSGKTTALLDRVEAMLEEDGIDVNDLLLVSYTRAAAAEVRERLAERQGVSPRSLRGNVGTMHATAYDLLNLSRDDVVDESDKEAFCEDYGLEYEDEYKSGGRRTARSTALGNKIIATSQWLQRTNREVADWYDVPFHWNVEEVRLPADLDPKSQEGNKYTPTWSSDDDRVSVPESIRGWRAYKGEEGIVGFADMLERVTQRSLIPSVDHLAIDEFQDITQLQYDVYQEWKPQMDRVIIAGDDDQVVYAWQGADPKLLLDEGGDDVILDTSYRLPSNVLQVVQRVIHHISERQEKNLTPRMEGGDVEFQQGPSVLDLVRDVRDTVDTDDGSIMVLFRARYQMFDFMDEFVTSGIPFSVMTDGRMWTDRLGDYADGIANFQDGEPVTGLQARRLADMLVDSAFGSNERDELFDAIDELEEAADTDDLTELRIDPDVISDHAPFMPDRASAADMVRKVTKFQKTGLRSFFANDYRDEPKDRVRVGTIHSAKGREADHVYVATDLTEKVVEHMASTAPEGAVPEGVEFTPRSNPVPVLTDNERRVFFVGMSRARERLVVMENLIDGAPTLPIDVLLCNEPRPDISLEELIEETLEAPAKASATD